MAAIDQNIIGVTRTVYGVYLQTLKNLGLPFNLVPNTTLNERFNVQAGVVPSSGQMPNMRYLAIGNRGHSTVVADDGSDETIPVPHRPSDAGMYGQIPFVLREPGNDLTASQRAKYALRVQETHHGNTYFAYYLRRMDLAGVNAQLNYAEVNNGIVTTTPFTPSSDNLNPEPPVISNEGVVIGSDTMISASAVINVQLGADDIAEIINAHRVRTNSSRSPVISELALVSGVDREVTGSAGGSGTFTYNEVIAAQINVHVSTYHALGYSANSANFLLDVGGAEPMLGGEGEFI